MPSFEGRRRRAPKQELREQPQSVTVELFYSAHSTPEDFFGIEIAFQRADIYVPEITSLTEEGANKMRRIAAGEEKPKKAGAPIEEMTTVHEFEQALLYDSQKPLFFADTPKGHEVDAMYDEINKKVDNAVSELTFGKNKDEILAAVEEVIRYNAEIIAMRDAYIAARLTDLTKNIGAYFPELADKKNVRILVQIGSSHVTIGKRMGDVADTVESRGMSPFPKMHVDELAKDLLLTGELDTEKLPAALMEMTIRREYRDLLQTIGSERVKEEFIYRIVERIVEHMPDDIIEELRYTFEDNVLFQDDYTGENNKQIIAAAIKKFTGIDMPTNETEVSAFVAQFAT